MDAGEPVTHDVIEDVHCGLALFQEETTYFSSKSVLPYRGIGEYPGDALFKVVLFQLDVSACPHLEVTDTRAVCRIYENRPLCCRCFPFQPAGLDEYGKIIFYIDPKCKAIQESRKENSKNGMIHFEASQEEKSGVEL
jgi:Fe-S-cluster containining protein